MIKIYMLCFFLLINYLYGTTSESKIDNKKIENFFFPPRYAINEKERTI